MDSLIAEVLSKYQKTIGVRYKLEQIEAKQASNEHYIVRSSSEFILKQVKRPDLLFGEGAVSHLDAVTRATQCFSAGGIPVENVRASDRGDHIIVLGDRVFRLFDYLSGAQSVTAADAVEAAGLLRRFHSEAWSLLPTELQNKFSSFRPLLPLQETSTRIPDIHKFLRTGRADDTALREILDQVTRKFDVVENALESFKSVGSDPGAALIHSDFHPGNVLRSKRGLVMIDLDNIHLGSPSKCIAFAVVRWTFWAVPPNRASFEDACRRWAVVFGHDSAAFREEMLYWSRYIEVEKILRILLRASIGREYDLFLKNILSRHLPALELFLSI